MKKPETGPDGLTFTDIYNGLCQRGWPIDIAWREALARVQWLENHEQETNKQEEKST